MSVQPHTFHRQRHQAIALVLQSLDATLLRHNGCWFGGGTAIALKYGEFRESVNIDFLVPDKQGYRHLRGLLTQANGIKAIQTVGNGHESLASTSLITRAREIRADQYGIRTTVGWNPC